MSEKIQPPLKTAVSRRALTAGGTNTTAGHPWTRWLAIAACMVALLLAGFYAWLWYLTATASVSTHGEVNLGAGNIEVPSLRVAPTLAQSALTQSLVRTWSENEFLDWQAEGKVTMTRVLVAKLAMGEDVAAVNDYIQSARVRGTVGSTSFFHPDGDYDFTLAGLCLILYSFGDDPDLLYPETVDHIVNVLMTEKGGTPIVYTPRILGLPLRDTENHILMTEGSRYLTNRWLQLHGNADPEFDNRSNGMESFLLEYLGHMENAGFHEYNSRPYIGYTLTALLNLQSFADKPVSDAATRVLDRANWEYALGSLQLRRFPPFRRQPAHAGDTDLDGDYHTAMIKAWMSLRGPTTLPLEIRSGQHQALWVAFTSYRLPDQTARWIEQKPSDYFVRIGHGHDGSPEIYSGGPGYLITAGGVARDRFEQAVARPTTLMLNDNELELGGLLQVSGIGADYRQWNNTGVYERFAVGKRVSVPPTWEPTASEGPWSIYQRPGQTILVYSADDTGFFYLLHAGDSAEWLARIKAQNPDASSLHSQFTTPAGQVIHYDTNAAPDTWVITEVSDEPVIDRDFSRWPLMSGEFPD